LNKIYLTSVISWIYR